MTHSERHGLTLTFNTFGTPWPHTRFGPCVIFTVLNKMLVSPAVALQMSIVLVERVLFWARSDAAALGEGGAKPQAWFFSSSKGGEQTPGLVLLLKGTDLCTQPDCAKCSSGIRIQKCINSKPQSVP